MARNQAKIKFDYENPKYAAMKVSVYERSRYFWIKYSMPIKRSRYEKLSLKIPFDLRLRDISTEDQNWWKKSSHKEAIQHAIILARVNRTQQIWNYLAEQYIISEDERDSEYDFVISNLLTKDRPLIASFLLTIIERAGLDEVFQKIPKSEMNRLNVSCFLRTWDFEEDEMAELLRNDRKVEEKKDNVVKNNGLTSKKLRKNKESSP